MPPRDDQSRESLKLIRPDQLWLSDRGARQPRRSGPPKYLSVTRTGGNIILEYFILKPIMCGLYVHDNLLVGQLSSTRR